MFDQTVKNLTGMRMVYLNAAENRLVLLKFINETIYTAANIVTLKNAIEYVTCSDDFSHDLTCVASKASGDVCLVLLHEIASSPGSYNTTLNCSLVKYHDLDISYTAVTGSIILLGGKLLSSNTSLLVIYQPQPHASMPVYVSGSVDTHTYTHTYTLQTMAICDDMPAIAHISYGRLYVHCMASVQMTVPAGLDYDVGYMINRYSWHRCSD